MIRQAASGDVAAIAALFERSFGTLTFLPALHTREEHLRWFERHVKENEVWVYDDGKIRGFATLGADELHDLYIDPPSIGRGIGTALLDHAKQRRPHGFTLWCFQANEPARGFYEKHGCVASEFTDGAGNEEKTPDVLYAWRPGR
ncbi:MAG TPA: GNAT family N-acetyltransferase [Gaiellaceae bacterium]|jgi:GNAT superfamily N-acetyltransferase|nr:GNAT family N-acetyltransferase [Gaiellaceae bacterium]